MVFNPKTFTLKPGKAPELKTVELNKPKGANNYKKKDYLKKVKTSKKLNILEAKNRKECAKKNIEVEDYPNALKNLDESIEMNNSDYETYILRANLNIHLGNFSEVLTDYLEAEKWIDSSFPSMQALKINLEIAKNNFDTAIFIITNFLKLEGIASKPLGNSTLKSFVKYELYDRRYAIFFKIRGDCYEKVGKYKLALEDLTNFTSSQGDDPNLELINYGWFFLKKEPDLVYKTRIQIAELNYKVNDFKESILQYSKLIADFPYEFEFYKKRSKIKKIINDEEGCKKDKKISNLIKKAFNDGNDLGNYQLIELLNKLITIDSNITFHKERALSFQEINEIELAILDWNQIIVLDPKNYRNYIQRGRLLIKQRKFNIALADFSKVIEINPDHLTAYIFRASIWDKLDNHNAVINDLKFVEKTTDLNLKRLCYVFLAEAEIKRNLNQCNIQMFKNALNYSKKAIDLDPRDSRGYAIRCFIFKKCKLPLYKFKKDIQYAIGLDPYYEQLSIYFNSIEIDELESFCNKVAHKELLKEEEKYFKDIFEDAFGTTRKDDVKSFLWDVADDILNLRFFI